MPSIITHDTFGLEVYDDCAKEIGQSKDEKEAFLLGCQGPDVMFYGVINPLIVQANSYAKKLHRKKCAQYIASLCYSPLLFDEENESTTHNEPASQFTFFSNSYAKSSGATTKREIAKAYTIGYLMHHELDSSMHPFVFSQEYAYCTAGIEGLGLEDASEVHVEIEREFDELILTTKRGETIASFDPSSRILRGSNFVLDTISRCVEAAIPVTYNQIPPANMYKLSVKATRAVQRAIYSTGGVKRNIFGSLETLFRNHSYLRAITHKNRRITESIFDNRQHDAWQHPWIDTKSNEGFWDIYECSVDKGKKDAKKLSDIIDAIQENSTTLTFEETIKKAESITNNLNFYGCPEDIANPKSGKPDKPNY